MFFQQQNLSLLLGLYFCLVLGLPCDEEKVSLRQVLGYSYQDEGDVLSVVLFLIPFECVSQLPRIKESEKEPLIVVI